MESTALIDRIVDNLARAPGARAGAEVQARAAFLGWAVALPRETDVRQAARSALARMKPAQTPAVALLRSYLEEATRPLPETGRRRSRRRTGR